MSEIRQYHYVMVPVPMPQKSESEQGENVDLKSSQTASMVGTFFWAIVLLLLFWFITGGYNALPQ
jgi:hypothetical protein